MLVGCQYLSKNGSPEIPTSQDDTEAFGKQKCEYTFDKDSVINGRFICFYPNGKTWQTGTIKNDSLLVFEYLVYYPTGKLKEYNFYNPIGEQRYQRTYNNDGDILNEEGSFLSHQQISKPVIKIGDSTMIKFYVASPPKISYKIYGWDSNGRYDIRIKKTDQDYIKTLTMLGKKPGNFVLYFEVDVLDESGDIIKTIRNDVSFKVK